MVSVCLPPLPDVQVVALWRKGRASYDEIRALRLRLPEVAERPIAAAFREARSSTKWVLATCHPA